MMRWRRWSSACCSSRCAAHVRSSERPPAPSPPYSGERVGARGRASSCPRSSQEPGRTSISTSTAPRWGWLLRNRFARAEDAPFDAQPTATRWALGPIAQAIATLRSTPHPSPLPRVRGRGDRGPPIDHRHHARDGRPVLFPTAPSTDRLHSPAFVPSHSSFCIHPSSLPTAHSHRSASTGCSREARMAGTRAPRTDASTATPRMIPTSLGTIWFGIVSNA